MRACVLQVAPVTAIGSAAVASDTRPPSSPLLSTTSQALECTQRLRTQDVSVHEHDAATNTPRGSCPAKDAAPGTHIRQRCRTLFIPRSAAQSLSHQSKTPGLINTALTCAYAHMRIAYRHGTWSPPFLPPVELDDDDDDDLRLPMTDGRDNCSHKYSQV